MSVSGTTTTKLNGIDTEALQQMVSEVGQDPSKGRVEFRVRTEWKGGTRSEASVDSYTLAGEQIARRHRIAADEPVELLGGNSAPNPQELLMAALNACIMVGYVAGAAVNGITLEKVEIETSGELDLRGFLGIDESVKPGYDSLQYVVRIKGNGTPEQFKAIHENVMKTSPNYFNVSRAVPIRARLEVAGTAAK
jgi:uncharacterized OsmC-like protein